MKIIKRNQIIILVMSFMLITAGYMNYKNNNELNNTQVSAIITGELGDATLVSSNISENKMNDVVIEEIESIPEEDYIPEVVEETINELEKNKSTYFINSKLERSNMYSEMLETYQKIYNDVSSTADVKAEAIQKISEINNQKNAIMIAENLVQTKGINNLVIFANANSVSIVIEAEELIQEQIAQVQNIVSRELSVEIEKIHISTI